jgi:hypothetical protein
LLQNRFKVKLKHTFLILVFLAFGLSVTGQKYIAAYASGNYEKAIKYAEKEIDANAKNLDAYLIKAMANLHLGTDSLTKSEHSFGVESAFSTLKLIIKKDKSGEFVRNHAAQVDSIVFANYEIAKRCLDNDKTEKAERIINDLIAIEPKPEYYYLVGKMWLNEGDELRGINMFNDAAAKIYLDAKAGIQPDDYLYEIFDVLATNIADHGGYEAAYIIYNRGLDLFTNGELEAAYYQFVKNIAEYGYLYNDSARQMNYIMNLDTVAALTTRPGEFNALKWDMLMQYFNSHEEDDYYGAAKVLEGFICKEKATEYLDLFYNNILLGTYVETRVEGPTPLDGRKYMFTWLRLQNCLYGKTPDVVMFEVMDSLLATRQLKEAAKWMYNIKIQKVDAKKIASFESSLYALIKNADTSEFAFMNLYELTNFFPQNKNFLSLRDKGAYAEIIKLIDTKKFSEAGKLLRTQLRVNPRDKTINDLYQLWVINDYKENFLGSSKYIETPDYKGSIENCEPGKLNAESQKIFLQRLNYFRRVAGVPDQCVLRESWNEKCQAAALMMTSNYSLSHFPPKDWSCYSADGVTGAGNSNLSLGYSGVSALLGQLDDSGDNNYLVGHRRWILNPARKVFGHGSTEDAMALWALGGENSDFDETIKKQYENQYVCWPPEYYFPSVLNTQRWSVSLRGGDFSKATVKMYWGNSEIEVKILEYSPGYGLNTLVWEPQEPFHTWSSNNSYKVVVSNIGITEWDEVKDEWVTRYTSFTYTTTMLYIN